MIETNYIILEATEVSSINFNEIEENNVDTLRYSVDGTQTIVKFKGTTPDFLVGKTQYTHQEILIIVGTSEWNKSQE
tara:strand:+ start:1659 stop:1889 length:231 start_codon:yes stop_codon:yes gene_type:complete